MIAFLILAHTDPHHVQRLAASLRPHDVFVHLDAKTKMNEEWRGVDATYVVDRSAVYWAGFSQVEATLKLLDAALGTGIKYDRVVLLSGSCYPIQPVNELLRLFESLPRVNFIKYVAVANSGHLPTLIDRTYFRDGILPWKVVDRFAVLRQAERVIRKGLEVVARPIRRRRLPEWEPLHGSAYWAVTHECATHISEVAKSRSGRRLTRYYKHAFASDEQFFHTIVGNSVFDKDSTGRIPYTGRGTYRAANLHLVDPSLARWFNASDIEEIRTSEMYFVRKVNSAMSTELLDILDNSQ